MPKIPLVAVTVVHVAPVGCADRQAPHTTTLRHSDEVRRDLRLRFGKQISRTNNGREEVSILSRDVHIAIHYLSRSLLLWRRDPYRGRRDSRTAPESLTFRSNLSGVLFCRLNRQSYEIPHVFSSSLTRDIHRDSSPVSTAIVMATATTDGEIRERSEKFRVGEERFCSQRGVMTFCCMTTMGDGALAVATAVGES
ncbi:hypothetical protein TIFTF001_030468 [Ficus carica]|uniref:Uncharacterized protein n=1 Tax=Ficus carica TaxID=3494 RepID=A0AA88DXM7_FICCA|nr:hypothetical protein TIFTF001_030468 [Ficus carica]